jgi:predicted nuclease of predicted toxin-antitoxin system
MPLSFYFDQHVPAAIVHALRLRGVNVLQALADKHDRAEDEQLLLRATTLGRILFTQDEDLLALAHRYQAENRYFAGVVYAHQIHITIGKCIADLEIISKASSLEEMANRVEFLPL